MKNIVILGGSYAGISTAHRLLKHVGKTAPFKITLVSPNTHFYWSMAAARGLVPGQISDEQLFRPIAEGFEQYPANQFKFVLGSAESVNVEAKHVGISGSTGASTLDYDFLIIATGSRAKGDAPFKGVGSTEDTKAARNGFHVRVEKARTIVVAGGGVTGCETAGELAYEYGREKEIIFIAGHPTLLSGTPTTFSTYVQKSLQTLKVNLKLSTQVKNATQLPDGSYELLLSTGEKLTTDTYIPTFGLTPNSSYLPTEFLDPKGYVVVDSYLKVLGVKDVWAIGDVSNCEWSQLIPANKQSAHLAKSIMLLLNNKTPLPYKTISHRITGMQIGRNKGIGHFGSWIIPSFVIVYVRRMLFMEKMGAWLDGSEF
ncbi:FAD/NAD(P)-binding domain-containing protein [Hyaloscypha bicolor E]|uniref:FAD/NAD(P)-binding domain-containing protein n=1 Tax=Hyaloscypha bicolor E TaxID=1095630 RepID=A0A2J6T4J7_9HELO|nr:FAD/NAD(P)-binding domain-containing protein [Hyaloscypha bicolor E]PMD57853.1 FAD/NAD(P)-binding domain-containing protein [Hyaloscypha bicolor E]